MINLDEMYRTALVNRQSAEPIDVMRDGSEMIHLAQAAVPKGVEPAGTVRPGALAGEMRPIEQSVIESIMERTGASLEQIGMALDSLGKVKLGPLEIGIRDFLPFVGGSETVVDPITGKEEVVQVGTPAALQQMGRGESAVRGTGFATQMTPDVKLAAFDVPTIGAAAKVSAKAARQIGREIATTPPTGSIQIAPTPIKLNNQKIGTAFNNMVKDARQDFEEVMFNWENGVFLNDDADKLITYPGRDQAFSRGKEGGKVVVTKREMINWLMSDGPFDKAQYGADIKNDKEWADKIERLRSIVREAK